MLGSVSGENMKFTELGLNKFLLSAIEEQGYTKPTPIQAKAIPHV